MLIPRVKDCKAYDQSRAVCCCSANIPAYIVHACPALRIPPSCGILLEVVRSYDVLTVQDYGSYGVLADIGGGYGQLVMDIMDANPGVPLLASPIGRCGRLCCRTMHAILSIAIMLVQVCSRVLCWRCLLWSTWFPLFLTNSRARSLGSRCVCCTREGKHKPTCSSVAVRSPALLKLPVLAADKERLDTAAGLGKQCCLLSTNGPLFVAIDAGRLLQGHPCLCRLLCDEIHPARLA